MMRSASWSCGPQSHFSEPNTSPVRHSLCSRTSGGLPPNAPTTSATCSWPSSDARKATICVGGMSSSGSLARATISTDGWRRSRTIVVDAITASRGLGRRAATRPAAAPAEPRQVERRAWPSRRSRAKRLKRTDGRAVEVACRDRRSPARRRDRASCVRRSPPARRVGGIALVGEFERRRALAADQQPRDAPGRAGRAAPGVAVSTASIVDGVAVEPHRPAGAQRGDRAGGPAVRSKLDLADQRHMVRRPLPVPARLEHLMRRRGDRRDRARPTCGRAAGRGPSCVQSCER